MGYSIYNTIRSMYALFMFNFMLCALGFWAAHSFIINEERQYVFSYILEDNYLSIVSGYLITYGVMSFVFSVLFILFKLYDTNRKHKLFQYFKILCILLLVAFLLYISAWFYWDIGKGLSPSQFAYKVIPCFIIDQFGVYLRGIMLWLLTTTVVTYLFVRLGLTPDVRYDA